jgi:hypothetical protein
LKRGNRYQPRRHRGSALEPVRLPPHVEEDLAQKVFGRGSVSDKAKEPAIDGGAVPGEQGMHGKLVTSGDAGDQNAI